MDRKAKQNHNRTKSWHRKTLRGFRRPQGRALNGRERRQAQSPLTQTWDEKEHLKQSERASQTNSKTDAGKGVEEVKLGGADCKVEGAAAVS